MQEADHASVHRLVFLRASGGDGDEKDKEGAGALVALRAGRDAAFLGENADEVALLVEEGRRVDVIRVSQLQQPQEALHPERTAELPHGASRVFATPLGQHRALLFWDAARARLVFSANVSARLPPDVSPYAPSPDPAHAICLRPDSAAAAPPPHLLALNWHPSGRFFALLLTDRILILSQSLEMLALFAPPAATAGPVRLPHVRLLPLLFVCLRRVLTRCAVCEHGMGGREPAVQHGIAGVLRDGGGR